MNFKTTIVLIVLLGIVGTYFVADFYRSWSGAQKTPDAKIAQGRRLMDCAPADLQRIVIRPSGGIATVLERSEGAWRLKEPLDAATDSSAVGAIVSGLMELRSQGQIELGGVNDSATGLQNPSFTVEVVTAGGVHTLEVGQKSGLGDVMYVRLDAAARADLVASALYQALASSAEDLRKKDMISVTSADVRQVVIQRSGQETIALHMIAGVWWMTEPVNMRVDESQMEDLLFGIASFRADAFVSSGSAEAAGANLQEPQARVWFSTEEAPAAATQPSDRAAVAATQPSGTTITFGAYQTSLRDSVYASLSSSPSIVRVNAYTMNRIAKTVLDLRNRALVDINPDSVQSITLTIDQPATEHPTTRPATHRETTIVRNHMGNAAKWLAKDTNAAAPSEAAVNSLLASFHPLRVHKYLPQMPQLTPIGTYTLKLSVRDPGKDQIEHTFVLIDSTAPTGVGQYNDMAFQFDRGLLAGLNDQWLVVAGQ